MSEIGSLHRAKLEAGVSPVSSVVPRGVSIEPARAPSPVAPSSRAQTSASDVRQSTPPGSKPCPGCAAKASEAAVRNQRATPPTRALPPPSPPERTPHYASNPLPPVKLAGSGTSAPLPAATSSTSNTSTIVAAAKRALLAAGLTIDDAQLTKLVAEATRLASGVAVRSAQSAPQPKGGRQ